MVSLWEGVFSMTQEQVKLRLDKSVLEFSQAFHAVNHTSRTQYIQDAYIQKMIRDLTSIEPGIQASHGLLEAKENLLKQILEEVDRLQELVDILKEDIAAHKIVSDENIHNNLNDLMNQISIIDSAVKFYGQPRIEARSHTLLKTYLNSQTIAKFGKMFVQIFSDKRFETDKYLLFNEIIGNFPSPEEVYKIFQDDPKQETVTIIYIADVFYREQLNKMIDEIHEKINHQIPEMTETDISISA